MVTSDFTILPLEVSVKSGEGHDQATLENEVGKEGMEPDDRLY